MRMLAQASSNAAMEGNASQMAVFLRNSLSTPAERHDCSVPSASMALGRCPWTPRRVFSESP